MPFVNVVFAAEVGVKLVEYYMLTREGRGNVFRMEIRVLSCPAYFDQPILLEAQTSRKSKAWTGVDSNTRICSGDLRLNAKAHTGAIAHKRSEIKMQKFLCWCLLRGKSTGQDDKQQRRGEHQSHRFFSQSILVNSSNTHKLHPPLLRPAFLCRFETVRVQ